MAQLDQYLPCESYAGKSNSEFAGFTIFTNEEDNLHYFCLAAPDGSILLRSQGYQSEASRDNGINSVIRNRDLEDRYRILQDEDDQLWYISLRAGNHQEIALSCGYGSEEDAQNAIPRHFSSFDWASFLDSQSQMLSVQALDNLEATEVVPDLESKSTGNNLDEYLDCAAYVEQGERDANGFVRFMAGEQYYFNLSTEDGAILLRSQGYTTEAARNNGVESVQKNRDLSDRYKVITDEENQYFLILKAGNHQEIARSCNYDSEETALASIAMCSTSYIGQEVEYTVDLPTEKIEVNKINVEVLETTEVEESEPLSLENRKIIEEREARATHIRKVRSEEAHVGKTIARTVRRIDQDEYLPCDAYTNQGTPDSDGFVTFEKDGKYYFAMHSPEGEVVFRSESFHLSLSRDNALRAAKRSKNTESAYSVEQEGDFWYVVLKSSTQTEIARSCPFDDEEGAIAWRTRAYGWRNWEKVAVVAAVAPVVTEVLEKRDVDADLIEESEIVEGDPSSIETISASTMAAAGPVSIEIIEEMAEEEVVEEEVEVAPIPEPEPEPEPVVIPEVLVEEEELVIEEEAGVGVEEVAVAAAAASVFIPETNPEPEPKPEQEFIPQWKAKEEVVAPPPVPEVVEASKGFNWLWLIPILLGLLALLWLIKCNTCSQKKAQPATTSAAAMATVDSTEQQVQEAETDVAPVPTDTPISCACELTHPMFAECTGELMVLTKLGTAPEFRNVHGLTTKEFLEKLTRNANRAPHHRDFLNKMAKAMGYSDFYEISVDAISEVNVPYGTEGKMGQGPRHDSKCVRLNASSEKDLMAFRIRSKNGCDVHFMKTCGNHFFFCEK